MIRRYGISVLMALVCWALLTSPVWAANHFIRQNASGNGSGSDWTNARTDFPVYTDYVRGDTYYVADGSYSTPNMAKAVSGTSVITIKKASVADHGTSTGWDDAYGDGVAILGAGSTGGTVLVTTSYWVIDGSYRNETTWNTPGSYGFRFLAMTIDTGTAGPDNVTIQYSEIGGPYSSSVDLSYLDRPIYLTSFNAHADNWTFRKNFFHNSGEWQINNADNVLIEYNFFEHTWGKETIRSQFGSANNTIRYNFFKDTCRDDYQGERCSAIIGYFVNGGDTPSHPGLKIYGNVFSNVANGGQDFSDGIISVQSDDCVVYNNTAYNIQGNNGTGIWKCSLGGASTVRNNIQYYPNGLATGCIAGTCSDNSYYTSSPPFVNVSTLDFHLTGALAGATFASPYDYDMEGNQRGGDGTFDRGAYEYGVGSVPNAPTSFRLASWAGLLGLLGLLLPLIMKGIVNGIRNSGGGWTSAFVRLRQMARRSRRSVVGA